MAARKRGRPRGNYSRKYGNNGSQAWKKRYEPVERDPFKDFNWTEEQLTVIAAECALIAKATKTKPVLPKSHPVISMDRLKWVYEKCLEMQDIGNLLINAGPGCAKTTTVTAGLHYAKALGLPVKYVTSAVFSNTAKNALNPKMPEDCSARTVHSFSHQMLFNNWRERFKGLKVSKSFYQVAKVIAEAKVGNDKETFQTRSNYIKALEKSMMWCAITPQEVIDVMNEYNIDSGHLAIEVFAEAVAQGLEEMCKQPIYIKGVPMVTFPLMVYAPWRNGWEPQAKDRFRVMITDECQDISPALKEILKKWADYFIFIGDRHQCVEINSLIDTPNGRVKAKDLKPGDKVLSYRNGEIVSQTVRHNKKSDWTWGYKVTTYYSGATQEIVMSPNHKIWAFNGTNTDISDSIIVDAHSTGGTRMQYMWHTAVPICTCKDILAEQGLHIDFNIEKINDGQYYIEYVNDNYRKVLQQADKLSKLTGANIIETLCVYAGHAQLTIAANLSLNMSLIINYNGKARLASVISIEKVNGEFVDLDVDDASNFFSDGILSHNSIFHFAGADSNSIDNLINDFECSQLPLMETFRCPKKIVERCNDVNPDLRAAETNIDGDIIECDINAIWGHIQPGDVVLSRKKAPLITMCFGALRRGIKANIINNDIGDMLVSLMRQLKPETPRDLIEKTEQWREETVEDYKKKGWSTSGVAERADCLIALVEGLMYQNRNLTIRDITDDIDERFKYVSDEDTKKKDTIMFGTIHRAKGLEWPRVWILADMYLNHGRMTERDHEEEKRIRYVGESRVQNLLGLVYGTQLSPFDDPDFDEEENYSEI